MKQQQQQQQQQQHESNEMLLPIPSFGGIRYHLDAPNNIVVAFAKVEATRKQPSEPASGKKTAGG
jgi:hypothetical protein